MIRVWVAVCTKCEKITSHPERWVTAVLAQAHEDATKHKTRLAEGWTEDTTGTIEIRRFDDGK